MLCNLVTRQSAQLCPGGAYEIKRIEPIRRVNGFHILMVIRSIGFFFSIPAFNLLNAQSPDTPTSENFAIFDFNKLQ